MIELAGQGRAELARLLPEAGEPAAARDGEFAQARLFEVLLSLLGRVADEAPLVLVIEDLHWADRSTRDFLSFLLRATRRERLVLVATYRSDELHRRHPLRPFLANVERLEGVRRLEVQPFSRLELSAQLLGSSARTPTPRSPTRSSSAPAATRSSPRSCWPPPRTATGTPRPRPCATR